MTTLLRRVRLALAAALMLATCLVLPEALASSHKPPPLPDCFKTGSGYGTCEGMVIPGGGSVAKVEAADAGKDRFEFTGPVPLQSEKPVACGEVCIYNHLDWTVGNGATIVSDCQTNDTRCIVKVARRSSSWAVVYVRQNNDAKQLWAIWNSGRRKYKISGNIEAICHCGALGGITVKANGGDGSGSDESDAHGHYSIEVPEGNYTVKPQFGGYGFTPRRRTHVKLNGGDKKGVDFAGCPSLPSGVVGATRVARAAAFDGVATYSGKSRPPSCPQQYVSIKRAKSFALVEQWSFTPSCQQNGKTTHENVVTLRGDPKDPKDTIQVGADRKFYLGFTLPAGNGHLSGTFAKPKKSSDAPPSATVHGALRFTTGGTKHCLNVLLQPTELFAT